MKHHFFLAAALVFCAHAGTAQNVGPIQPDGTQRVTTANGTVYTCKPGKASLQKKQTLKCQRADKGAVNVFGAGTVGGLAAVTAMSGGVVLLGAIASDMESGVAATTTWVFKR